MFLELNYSNKRPEREDEKNSKRENAELLDHHHNYAVSRRKTWRPSSENLKNQKLRNVAGRLSGNEGRTIAADMALSTNWRAAWESTKPRKQMFQVSSSESELGGFMRENSSSTVFAAI